MGKSKVSFLIDVDIVIEKDEGGYHAFCPSFKGLHTCGKTIKETLSNTKDAIAAYVVSLLKHKEPLPCCRIVRQEACEESSKGTRLYKEVVKIPEVV